MSENALSVSVRSDGLVSITSAPIAPGAVQAQCMIMTRELALWVSRELLRLASDPVPPPSGTEERSK